MKQTKVLVKINDNNKITEITSSIFADENDGYIVIDEGVGDRFVHAQNNYLTHALLDETGAYNYTLNNKQVKFKGE